ncbi:hypothetical protein [Paenibacillus assamensis]|uniref:hypothetical protein n=1 Tax=Paenibacillus assamensis TaxID=311244 RepID=UPI0004920520|nr:hypothetical protein [Paenibacillus assamensis]
MKNKFIIITIIIIFVISIYQFFGKNNQNYIQVSGEQVSTIIENEKITRLSSVEILSDDIPITIISYRTNDEIGAIEALNNNGKLEYRKSIATDINNEKKVEVLGVNGGFRYIIITFYDEELLNNTKNISVLYNGNLTNINDIKVDRKSYIIPFEGSPIRKRNTVKLEFWDSENNIIYNYPGKSKGD